MRDCVGVELREKDFSCISTAFRRKIRKPCPRNPFVLQGSTNRWAPGCVNAAGKLRKGVLSKSRNKIHQTWGPPISGPLYISHLSFVANLEHHTGLGKQEAPSLKCHARVLHTCYFTESLVSATQKVKVTQCRWEVVP